MTSAAPVAELVQSSENRVALYSPKQAAWGAILGGPAPLILFLHRNFVALGNAPAARKTLMIGMPTVLAFFTILLLLPAAPPTAPFVVLYWFGARGIVESKQLSKDAIIESSEYTFHSNWSVLWNAVLWGLISYILIMGVAVVLILLGVM